MNKKTSKDCGWFEILPKISKDTCDGKPIRQGVVYLRTHAGVGEVDYKGKKHKVSLSAGLDGSTFVEIGDRYAKINIERFIKAAIDAGLTDETIDFATP